MRTTKDGATAHGVAMTVQIPQGMLSLYEAIDRIVRRKFPDKDHTDRVEGEEAWRELCKHILEGRISPHVLTGTGESHEADRAQFRALQERYIFFADRLRYDGEEPRYQIEGYGPLTDTLRNVYGRNVRGQLCFDESDFLKQSSLHAPRRRWLPRARDPELCKFLKSLGPCSETAARQAAEARFDATITRERIRKLRSVKGTPGRPRKSLKKNPAGKTDGSITPKSGSNTNG